MRSYRDPRYYDDGEDDRSTASKRLYLNMLLCLGVIFLAIFGCQWIFSDISGVYSVNQGTFRSPVVLSLVRKPASMEGALSLAGGDLLVLNNSDNTRDDQIHLVFTSPKKQKPRRELVVQVDGVYKDGKIDAVLTSGGQSVKLLLERDPSASLHKIMKAHLPF